ncbi:MAG: hypothetical protein IKQ35_04080 [Bacilli bacterium]|nr:hypothetical protein [Bacilli bacterium]
MDKQVLFDRYINAYKKLSLDKKREYLIEEYKRTLAYLEKLKKDLDIHEGMLLNREIIDFGQGCSDDDFVEASYVYLKSLQESLGLFLEKLSVANEGGI